MLSRVADSLYWMSRYLERAEHIARLLDVNLQGMLDYSSDALHQRWCRLMDSLAIDRGNLPEEPDAYEVTRLLTFGQEHASSILACIHVARENARQIRQLISSEMWEQINSLYLRLRNANMDSIWSGQPFAFYNEIKMGIHLIQGVTDSTIIHSEGWHFIQIGKYLERASSKAMLLEVFLARTASLNVVDAGDYLDWVSLLRSCTAFEAYCKEYTADVRPEWVAEFLLLNPSFPHSIAFCAGTLQHGLEEIADCTDMPRTSKVNRLAGRLRAELDFSNIEEVLAEGLRSNLREIQQRCAEIHNELYDTYLNYPIEAALA